MLPKYHIAIGFLISALVYFLFPQVSFFEAALIFLSSFLIDVDHYLYYVWKKKDWSLKRAHDTLVKNRKFLLNLSPKKRAEYKTMIMVFHGFECWIILGLLVLINNLFLFVLMGVIIHMVLDFIELYVLGTSLKIKTSFIHVHKLNKNKKPLPDNNEKPKK